MTSTISGTSRVGHAIARHDCAGIIGQSCAQRRPCIQLFEFLPRGFDFDAQSGNPRIRQDLSAVQAAPFQIELLLMNSCIGLFAL